MSMNTDLAGRLRNTPLPRSHGLLPLFEAVVNSIQAVAASGLQPADGEIVVDILRVPQQPMLLDAQGRRGAPPQEPIMGFKVRDNGCGFDDANLQSFQTLDSAFKAAEGCRGVGRLLWLKAFDSVRVVSDFYGTSNVLLRRAFSFTVAKGVDGVTWQTRHRALMDGKPKFACRGSGRSIGTERLRRRERLPTICSSTVCGISCEMVVHRVSRCWTRMRQFRWMTYTNSTCSRRLNGNR